MEHFLNIIIFLTLLIFNENIEAKQHYSDNWGSEIIQGIEVEKETTCAIYCSKNEHCSSYIFRKWNLGSKNDYFWLES